MSIENLSPKGELLDMRIGYARVSTRDQNLELHLDALNKAGCKRIFTDKLSGAEVERPGLKEALSHLRECDTLVVQKRIAIHFSVLPTRPALYSDPEVLAKNPFFKIMVNVFNNAVARPSTIAGADYNQVSTAIFQHANNVLTGTESGKDAVVQIEGVAKRLVH